MKTASLLLVTLALALSSLGCFRGDGAHDAPTTPRHEAARAREAGKWEGTYSFSECAPSSSGSEKRCWRYEVIVSRDGNALLTTEGEGKRTQINARPRVEKETLRLAFVSYANEGPDVGDVGLRTLDPIRGRFSTGEGLATLSHLSSGQPCFHFEKLESKIATKKLCAPEP